MTVYQHRCPEGSEDGVADLLAWTTAHSEHYRSFADGNDSTLKEVRPFHPVYVTPQKAIRLMQEWSRSRGNIATPLSGEI